MRPLTAKVLSALVALGIALATLLLGGGGAGAAAERSATHNLVVKRKAVGTQPIRERTARPLTPVAPGTGRIPVSKLRVMSYTPADSPWIKMWNDFPKSRIDTDFAQIAGIGANTVRIAIAPWGVGFPKVTAAGAGKLRTIVDLAKKHGLALQFTLFDWSAPFSDEAGSLAWMKQLLTPYKYDRSIALVEVKNEVDVDQPTVLPWARKMLAALPAILPGVPRTISVGGSQTLAQMQKMAEALPPSVLDVVNIHLYGPTVIVQQKLANAEAVAAGRPIFVGEMGRSIDATTMKSASACVADDQTEFYKRTRLLLAQRNVTGYGVWVYTDISPKGAPTKYLGTEQMHFGLRTLSGKWKPAASVVKQMMTATGTGAQVLQQIADSAGTFGAYDGSFECSAALPSSATVSGYETWAVFNPAHAKRSGLVTGQGIGGSRAAFIGGTTADPRKLVPSVVRRFTLGAVKAVKVTASTRLASATGSTMVSIAWFKGSSYLGNSVSNRANNALTGWQSLSVTGKAPAGATTFQVHLMSATNTGNAYFDQVTVAPAR